MQSRFTRRAASTAHKQPEIALVYMGAHLDVFGLFIDEVTPSLIDDILLLDPRVGFKGVHRRVGRSRPEEAHTTGGYGASPILGVATYTAFIFRTSAT
jgi:hypothetical protein